MSEITIWLHVRIILYLDQVGLTFTSGSGSLNVTGNFAHSPDISPTNINYKMFGSTGFGSDYSITANTLSLQF
jgi:hypothetical protein